MRSTLAALAAVVIVTAALTGSLAPKVNASTGPIPLNCDRACLEGVINQYLAAVVKHDPSGLPLSEDVIYTENGQVLKVGDGFWKTAAGVGNYKHIFADPEFGQVALMGTMQEAGAALLLSLRLRIELGRITEIESVLLPRRRWRPQQHRRRGCRQGRRHLVQDDTACAAPAAPADDRDCRRVLLRPPEERR